MLVQQALLPTESSLQYPAQFLKYLCPIIPGVLHCDLHMICVCLFIVCPADPGTSADFYCSSIFPSHMVIDLANKTDLMTKDVEERQYVWRPEKKLDSAHVHAIRARLSPMRRSFSLTLCILVYL